jgi:type VI protein secretion system component Hcp
VTLEVKRKAGGNQGPYLVYKMTNVFVSSIQAGPRGKGDEPVETMSLNFAKIAVTYVPYDG